MRLLKRRLSAKNKDESQMLCFVGNVLLAAGMGSVTRVTKIESKCKEDPRSY